MGNAQPGSMLTRTTGALDSYVAELGNDIIFDKRSPISIPVLLSQADEDLIPKPRFSSVSEDSEMSTSEWIPGGQDIHQT